MARTIVQLILVFYGIWVLYCVFQFTHGDSWAAKTLAGVTLALFTGVLGFFIFKIWQTARRLKKVEGDASGLYESKENWIKYSIFYEAYRKDFWWLFVPVILYSEYTPFILIVTISQEKQIWPIEMFLTLEQCLQRAVYWPLPMDMASRRPWDS